MAIWNFRHMQFSLVTAALNAHSLCSVLECCGLDAVVLHVRHGLWKKLYCEARMKLIRCKSFYFASSMQVQHVKWNSILLCYIYSIITHR